MREIKFRAWDIVRKRMLCNEDLWDIPYNEIFIHTPDQRALNLMQYTGLKDKNGKEIYEGDIVNYFRNELAEVKFINGCFAIESKHYIDCFNEIVAEREVVGNIYENPELLG